MAAKADREYMQRALQLAEKGRLTSSPNPMVGAVIVKGGKVIGEGFHATPGKPHAEILALKQAGPSARGGTLYLNLEPCCHHGRTGPCTEAILSAGLKRVVFAIRDANPLVSGKGARILRKAGIEIATGLMRQEALLQNDKYFSFHANGRPFTILKTAQSLDGRIATSSGDSKWITSSQARKRGHALRAEVDAVLVGMGTVRSDNPALTVRHLKGPNPYRIIISTNLKFPKTCRLVDENSDYRTIIATTEAQATRFARTKRGKDLIFWSIKKNRNGSLNLNDLLSKARDFGIASILIEGGAATATSFLQAQLVDKVMAIVAPLIIGDGLSAVGQLHTTKIDEAIQLRNATYTQVGSDCIIAGYPMTSKGKL